jgi:oxygen-dependent protoporphyrinogen oxidase
MPDVLVIGAGVTGLACGHALARAGVDALVLEAASRAGGVIGGFEQDGFRFETGPNTIPANAGTLRALAGELGIADQFCVSRPAARRRYLFHRGRLRALPRGPLSLLTTGLLSPGSKLRLALEPLRKRAPLTEERNEPTFEALMAERLGKPAARTLAGAFVRGVYAAEAGQLGAASAFPRLWSVIQTHGGLVRGMLGAAKARRREGTPAFPGPDCPRNDLLSFSGGLTCLTDALAESIGAGLRLDTRVERLERLEAGFRAHLAGGASLDATEVVVTLPAQETVEVVGPLLARLDLPLLQHLPHASVTVVNIGLSDAPLPEGFGFLVPPDETGPEAPRALGVLFVSRIFPGRAPAGQDAVAAIYATPDLGEEDPVEVALEDLRRALGTRPEAVTSRVIRWGAVIPRYDVGHAPRAAWLVEAARAANPGLYLAGNYVGGVSVDDCLARGLSVARSLRGGAA